MNVFHKISKTIKDTVIDIQNYVVNNPIDSCIYSVAMKIFGLYCKNYFYPVGFSMFCTLLPASFVIDIAAFTSLQKYKSKFLKSILYTPKKVWDKAYIFFYKQSDETKKSFISKIFKF